MRKKLIKKNIGLGCIVLMLFAVTVLIGCSRWQTIEPYDELYMFERVIMQAGETVQ